MYYYIINPTSGRGAINQIQDRLREKLVQLGISGEFAKTTGPGDATKMTETAIAKGANTIVAVGGDGTINEVINGLGKANVALGIIPIGNSNLLASRLGITDWQGACEMLAVRRLTDFGLIAAGQKYFLSTLTLGFETDLDKNVDTAEPGLGARLGQFRQGFRHARSFKTLQAKITVDDSYDLECELFSLSLANQKFNNPLADNKLVINITDKPASLGLSTYLWGLIKRSEATDQVATTRFTASHILIDTKPVTGIMVDGKLTGRTPIAIRLTDRRVRFITAKPTSDFKAND